MSKGIKILFIIVLSILCVFLIALMIMMLNGNYGIFSGGIAYSEVGANNVYDGNFEEINISADASDIYIKSSSEESYKVIVYSKKEYISCRAEDGKISVSVNTKNKFNLFRLNEKYKIEIYVPSEYSGNIKVVNKYGDTDIDYFEKANADLQSSCGNIYIKGIGSAIIKSDFGDVNIDAANNLEINQSCGNITISNISNVIAVNNYGDIEIGKINGHFDLTSDCGNINIGEININESSKIESEFGDVKIGGTNEIYVDYNVSFGDVKINNNYNKSDITLKIDSSCGDVKIEN